MISLILTENSSVLTAIQGFLQKLLETRLVDALFVPLETEDGEILPALVTNPSLLTSANPLAPVMTMNSARAVSLLTGKSHNASIGAVLRSCEVRALVELVKLQQASLENLLLIGIDCPGTYTRADYQARRQPSPGSTQKTFNIEDHLNAVGSEVNGLRTACRNCTQPVPEGVNLHIQVFGWSNTTGILLEIKEDIAQKLGLSATDPAALLESQNSRNTVLDKLLAQRKQNREQDWAAIRSKMQQAGGFSALFTACIRCHNCKTACPICYCKTCLFDSAAFEHEPDHYLKIAQRKGAARLPGDTLLFHLTRLTHMGASCVGCGMCTSACPADIPVGSIFSYIGGQVQAKFEYSPGRSVADPLPMTTFQTQEWIEVGEVNR